MIRRAETRDLLQVTQIFKNMIEYCVKLGTDLFSEDGGTLITGIIEDAVLLMHNPDSVIFVDETEKGSIKGLIAGSIKIYPKYYRHHIVGEVAAIHPISFASKELFQAFEQWRIEKGATITTGFVLPGNTVYLKAVQQHGMEIKQHLIMGSFREKQKCTMNSETQE